MTTPDEIRAAGMGVSVRCEQCDKLRRMDDLHRQHIEDLRKEVAGCSEMEDFQACAFQAIVDLKNRWKLVAWAGWFLAALLAMGDAVRWGRP